MIDAFTLVVRPLPPLRRPYCGHWALVTYSGAATQSPRGRLPRRNAYISTCSCQTPQDQSSDRGDSTSAHSRQYKLDTLPRNQVLRVYRHSALRRPRRRNALKRCLIFAPSMSRLQCTIAPPCIKRRQLARLSFFESTSQIIPLITCSGANRVLGIVATRNGCVRNRIASPLQLYDYLGFHVPRNDGT